MNRLVVLDQPGGPAFVDALRRVWDDGDAAFVLDQRLPRPAAERLITAMRPAAIRTSHDETPLDHAVPVEPGDAVVVATSGTSGVPKGAVHTHVSIAASAEATSYRLGVRDDDHWLACLPVAHIGGLAVVMRALHLRTGLTVLPAFDAEAVMASPATLAALVPTALARIDPFKFRALIVGGARVPDNLPAHCLTTYGMTETGSGCVYNGLPLRGVDVRIDDNGQIHLRGPMLLREYRNLGDPKDHDGWLATGDLGEWSTSDGQRRLVVRGRMGELINSGGEKVWPDDVEPILAAHPAVGEVAVAGVKDAEWGQRVTAFVVPRSGAEPPSLDELRALVKEQLPGYCAPRALFIVDEIPRTAIGKVQRALLSERYADR